MCTTIKGVVVSRTHLFKTFSTWTSQKFPKDKQNVVGAMMDASFYLDFFFLTFFPVNTTSLYLILFQPIQLTLFFSLFFFGWRGECVCWEIQMTIISALQSTTQNKRNVQKRIESLLYIFLFLNFEFVDIRPVCLFLLSRFEGLALFRFTYSFRKGLDKNKNVIEIATQPWHLYVITYVKVKDQGEMMPWWISNE